MKGSVFFIKPYLEGVTGTEHKLISVYVKFVAAARFIVFLNITHINVSVAQIKRQIVIDGIGNTNAGLPGELIIRFAQSGVFSR